MQICRGVAQLVARVVWDHEVAGSIPVASTTLKDFSRNSRKFQKSPKCEKAHVCKKTACALNFVKFYKIRENTEKISKLNFRLFVNSWGEVLIKCFASIIFGLLKFAL